MLLRRLPSTAVSLATAALSRRSTSYLLSSQRRLQSFNSISFYPTLSFRSFCSTSEISPEFTDLITDQSSKRGPLKPGLALRVLKSADVILSEDTRHSGKLLHYYNIKTPLLSYHKYNESQREHKVLKRLKQGEIVALISDAGMPGISDPGTELAKICVDENIPVIPIPGPSAFLTALSASGLSTDEFTFVGFLPKHAGSRKERLIASASETTTQIFYVPPHKLGQFLEESSLIFGDSRKGMNMQVSLGEGIQYKIWNFWRGTLGTAKEAFSTRQPKGEITLLIEGNSNSSVETPSESQLENDLRELISNGHSLSSAVKLVAEGTSMKKKTIYSLALRKFVKKTKADDSD
ncbi:hypothetical protein GOBAR_DD23546 [Gossypium barbadense]|nr:hypothetical protein GOBAR_DD23546 [Gossypium barbadense]